MANNTGRCFCEYDHNQRLGSQLELLQRLEELGYEQPESRILTARYGVPLTAFLLLVRDSIHQLRRLDKDLESKRQVLGTLSLDEVIKECNLNVKDEEGANPPPAGEWQRARTLAIDPTLNISGVSVADARAAGRVSTVEGPLRDRAR